MADPVSAAPPVQTVQSAIRRAADATGVGFDLLLQTAQRESALNPRARAATSSATGLFQFIESTWLDMVRRHGGAHGLGAQAAQIELRSGRARVADPQARADILALRNDPEIAARMAAELARENASYLQARLGRAPSAGELYAAHVMGADGAARLIAAGARAESDVAALFPREADANPGLFYRAGAPVSAQALLARLDLDAAGTVSADAETTVTAAAPGAMSPALAHALFTMALLPLLGAEEREDDAFRALAAYARAQGV